MVRSTGPGCRAGRVKETPVEEETPLPRLLCDVGALAGGSSDASGVVWRLAESGRQLDANVVRLAPNRRVDTHTEHDLDVLLLVVSGGGLLGSGTADEPRQLTEGSLVWLPRGSTRSITAGPDGIAYVTVHRRRPGLRIGSGPPPGPRQEG
ncbi:hypothetical protein [Streptomyces sp. NPDC004065]|uniref:hypothetical protein n=1 Tax=Streptomyces sp. NPDC004065 TaxID=3364689 RepID=UPI00384C6A84